MTKNKIAVIDADDVLTDTNGATLRKIAENGTPVDLYKVDDWSTDYLREERMKLWKSPEFIRALTPMPGAVEFINQLRDWSITPVFTTAVFPECAEARIRWLEENFNAGGDIIITSRKDLVNGDIMLDDAPHNILASTAAYPILYRHPWSEGMSGCLSVNNLEEAAAMIDTIRRKAGWMPDKIQTGADIVCLIAPSGSGKTEVISTLCADYGYTVPFIETSGKNALPYYKTITKEKFRQNKDAGAYCETTSYMDEYYGIRTDEVENILGYGKIVIPTDICGANAMKRKFGSRVITVFLKTDRTRQIQKILSRDLSDDCKIKRIMGLDVESVHEPLCDYSFKNTDYKKTAEYISRL